MSSDILKKLADLVDSFKSPKTFSQSFYPESFVRKLIETNSKRYVDADTNLILYSKSFQYDSCERQILDFKTTEQQIKSFELPYKQVIDFVDEPNTKIETDGQSIRKYQPEDDWLRLTANNLAAFREANKESTPGPTLRIELLKLIGPKKYFCKLKRATYFDQGRTNLSLDLPLPETIEHKKTLRELDTIDNRLPEFHDSIMANTLGVSTCLFYTDQDSKEKMFYMRPRGSSRSQNSNGGKLGVSVFQNMVGLVSGVVEVDEDEVITDLVSHLRKEIVREMELETDLKNDEFPRIKVLPLAFVRELARGGKPQFFFLIELPPVDTKKAHQAFRNSSEGLQEFLDENISHHNNISQEAIGNFLYAFKYLDHRPKESFLSSKRDPNINEITYGQIYSFVRERALQMEQKPKTYSSMFESQLRDIICDQLKLLSNLSVTEESEKGMGRTDILVHKRTIPVLVGEIKRTSTFSGVSMALDQLLGYMTVGWDYGMLIIFNDAKSKSKSKFEFNKFIEQKVIPQLKSHPYLDMSTLEQIEQRYEWQAKFRSPLDNNRLLSIRVFVFNLI